MQIIIVKSTFLSVGGSVWELKIDPKRFREEIKNDLDPPKAIFGSKKRANQAQYNSKTNLEALFDRSRGPKEVPRNPQEPPKGSQNEPERPPKRLQHHLLIEHADFSKMLRFLS